MGEWKIEPVFAVRGGANAVRTPYGNFLPGPGLLISLGDGRAREMTGAELLDGIMRHAGKYKYDKIHNAIQFGLQDYITSILQQAQEARDVPNSAASGNACKVCGEPKLCDDCREDGNQRYGHEE